MKLVYSLVLLTCAFWEIGGYPYNPYYAANTDSLTFGAGDSRRGGMVLSRYYNPYYNTVPMGGGVAAFMVREPELQAQARPSQYYLPDRRRQVPENSYIPTQQNEVIPSFQGDLMSQPEKPLNSDAADIADPTEKVEILSTTLKTVVPELIEPEIDLVEEPEDEPIQKSKKTVTKKKQVKKPVEDEEDDEIPKMPAGAFFPMFFGWGGRSGGAPGGATAVANAYSTGRGGVASSHATAYGEPRPDFPRSNLRQKNN